MSVINHGKDINRPANGHSGPMSIDTKRVAVALAKLVTVNHARGASFLIDKVIHLEFFRAFLSADIFWQ